MEVTSKSLISPSSFLCFHLLMKLKKFAHFNAVGEGSDKPDQSDYKAISLVSNDDRCSTKLLKIEK
ncbi:hypothetical protein CHH80_07970 [Bacillus sp. 7504-2]|nr:hypothetical protein CHH80_07970 [Bacillus sp. 7504-2]